MIVSKGATVNVRYKEALVAGKVLSVVGGLAVIEMFLFGMGGFFVTRPMNEVF